MTQAIDFDKQFDLWLAAAQAISDDYMTRQFPMLRKPAQPPAIQATEGRQATDPKPT